MGIKERSLRVKEHTKTGILEAAMGIARKDGWNALSLRKIADVIGYTAPVIYEHFPNKDAILLELSRNGYLMLTSVMQLAWEKQREPEAKLEEMWLAYLNFASTQKELYQLMFGIGMPCCEMQMSFIESDIPARLVSDSIVQLMAKENPDNDEISRKYYTFWSAAHGLASIGLINKGVSNPLNLKILKHAIKGVIGLIRK